MCNRLFLGAAAWLLALVLFTGCAPEDDGGGWGFTRQTSGGMGGSLAGSGGSGPIAGAAGTMAPMTGGSGPDQETGGSGGMGVVGGAGGMLGSGEGGMGGSGGVPGPAVEQCYEFYNHGEQVAGDTSKYVVGPGEQYVCNNYVIPWTGEVEMVRYETIYDNTEILHHWLLYDVPGGAVDGTFLPCIGTHVLQDAQLVAGWAVGSNDVEMPPDVGLRMPGPDRSFMLEWHFYNSTPELQEDRSGIRICVMPKGTRPKTAGMTWLGTEFFNGPAGMPAGVESEFSGTCVNDSSEPITIFRLWPHMHQWGRNMNSVAHRADGTTEEVFDMPFSFDYQISYDANIVLMPGESITSTCRFHNMSAGPVAFGPSSDQEMCYQFAFSYPAGALDNGVVSLVGANNTCW
jgi:hypothetical protein